MLEGWSEPSYTDPVPPSTGLLRFYPLALLWAGAGCAAVSDGEAAIQADQSGFLGIMWVEQQAGHHGESSSASEVGGAFATYRGLDSETVLGLLGRDGAASGCGAAMQGTVDGFSGAFVDLHDVGELAVAVGDDRVQLHSRTFPDVAGIVSGAFYAEETPLSRAAGEREAFFFDASVATTEITAPMAFEEVVFDGATRASDEQEEILSLAPGRDVDIRWNAGDPADRVEVVIQAGGTRIRCIAPDVGQLLVSGVTTEPLRGERDAQLVLRRIRREAVVPFENPWTDQSDDAAAGLVWFDAIVRRSFPVLLGE